MVLTQEQLDFFHAHGYLAYGPLLTEAEVEELSLEYHRVFNAAFEDQRYQNLSRRQDEAETDQKMLQIVQMCDRSLLYRRLLYDTRILDIIQDLIGPNIILFHDQALFKPAHTGGPVAWHQDNSYWRCRPANLVSCWLTLDSVTRENGAMQVIPGSHLRPVWHNPTTSAVLQEAAVDASQAVVVELPAGGCMFHHCQTLHHTAPNTTDQERKAFAIHYMTPGTVSEQGPLNDRFSHPVLRLIF